jgi:hypothetical protein
MACVTTILLCPCGLNVANHFCLALPWLDLQLPLMVSKEILDRSMQIYRYFYNKIEVNRSFTNGFRPKSQLRSGQLTRHRISEQIHSHFHRKAVCILTFFACKFINKFYLIYIYCIIEYFLRISMLRLKRMFS